MLTTEAACDLKLLSKQYYQNNNIMKKSKILAIILLSCTGWIACKKEKSGTTNTVTPTTPPVVIKTSKIALLNQIWTLKETYEDGVQKTSNGKGRYEFNKYGNFRAELGTFQDIGTYKFTNKDSNELLVKLTGVISPYTWKLLKLDEHSLHTEFMSGTKKQNYNYER